MHGWHLSLHVGRGPLNGSFQLEHVDLHKKVNRQHALNGQIDRQREEERRGRGISVEFIGVHTLDQVGKQLQWFGYTTPSGIRARGTIWMCTYWMDGGPGSPKSLLSFSSITRCKQTVNQARDKTNQVPRDLRPCSTSSPRCSLSLPCPSGRSNKNRTFT